MSWSNRLWTGAIAASRRPFALVLAALSLLYLLPIWIYEFPEMLDYPAHLLMSRQLSEALLAPETSPWRVMPMPWPNLLFPALTALLQPIMDVNTAGKLVTSLAWISIPICTAFLLRRFGLPRWGALVSLPLTSPLVAFGFSPYITSLPPALLGIALAPSVSSLPRMAAFAALSAVVFFAHAAGFVLLGPAAVAVALARRRWRAAGLVALGYAIPAVLLLLPWAVSLQTSWHLEMHEKLVTFMIPLRLLYRVLVFDAWLVRIWDYRLLIVALVVFVGALLLPPIKRYGASRFAPATALLVTALALPHAAGGAGFLSERVICVAALLALLWLPIAPTTRRRRLHLAALVVCIAAHALSRLPGNRDFNTAVLGLRTMAGAIPPGSGVLFGVEPSPRTRRGDEHATWPFILVHNYLYFWRGTISNLYASTFVSSVVQAKEHRFHPMLDTKLLPHGIGAHAEARRFPFALRLLPETRAGRVGPFQPVYRFPPFTLYRNIWHEQSDLRLPAVGDVCRARRQGDREIACCDHHLRAIDAVRSCRQWGGKLAKGPRGAGRRWTGSDLPPALERCAVSEAEVGGWKPADCSTRARVLCQAVDGAVLRLPKESIPLSIAGRAHFLMPEEMPFARARCACAARGGRLVSVADRARALEVLAISQRPTWLGMVQRGAGGPWTTIDGRQVRFFFWGDDAAPRARVNRSCTTSDGSQGCDHLLPFCCTRPIGRGGRVP